MGTILVVDDDGHIRDFLRKSCSALATVIEAADGAQAIAAARWSHPDVVIMDLDMPVIDGFEAARQIKADPSLGDPILVALTGNETVNAVPRARAAGYSYFVRKETNARSFVETIARLVSEATASRSARPSPVSPAPPPAGESAQPAPAQTGRSRKAAGKTKRKPASKRAPAKKAAKRAALPARRASKKKAAKPAARMRRKP
ncbi:MAG: response regulator [Myxococcales bacterium]|jgi:two-component system cell cycle response regulator DivK